MNTEVVDEHLKLCELVLSVLGEENKMLRQSGEVNDELLAQKRDLLPQLDHSLAGLKELHETSPELMPAVKDKLASAQKKIMRILLLDRENEQLLLKSLMPKTKPVSRPSLNSIKSIYEKHRISGS